MSIDSPERLEALKSDELIERYRGGTARLDARLMQLDDAQLDQCFLPDAEVGQWSCRMLAGHLADAEIVNAFRLRKAVAESGGMLAMWDHEAWIDAGHYGGREGVAGPPVAGFVAAIHTTRLWMGDWLSTLDEAAWACRGLHAHRGEMTVRRLLAFTTWHLEHHAGFLTLKLDRLLGPAPSDGGA
ncbi:MAG: DinB family protein [Phycisphaerales bacterium]